MKDARIYIAALSAESSSADHYGMHIIGSLSDHSKTITCLAIGSEGTKLVFGSEDGMIRIWDTKSHNMLRVLKHAKGPVNNILDVERSNLLSSQMSFRKHEQSLPPPLEKYANALDDDGVHTKAVLQPAFNKPSEQQGSTAAKEMEMERLKLDCKKSMQMYRQMKKNIRRLASSLCKISFSRRSS